MCLLGLKSHEIPVCEFCNGYEHNELASAGISESSFHFVGCLISFVSCGLSLIHVLTAAPKTIVFSEPRQSWLYSKSSKHSTR
jgi:hypothetical protein